MQNNLQAMIDNLGLFISSAGKEFDVPENSSLMLLPRNCDINTVRGIFPRHFEGTEEFVSPESFISYCKVSTVLAHSENRTFIMAKKIKIGLGFPNELQVTAKFNHHGTKPGHRDFKAILSRPISSRLSEWLEKDSVEMRKSEAVRFIDKVSPDFSNTDLTFFEEEIKKINIPDLKNSISNSKVAKSEEHDLGNTNRKNESKASCGVMFKSNEDIPQEVFAIKLPILENGLEYSFPVRLSWDGSENEPIFTFHLDHAARIINAAMDDEIEGMKNGDFGEKLEQPIYL